MQFCSSRTLPGQAYAFMSSMTAGDSSRGFLVQILAELLDEVPRKNQHIVTALAERRNLNRKHRETEVEILAELTLPHSLLEIAIGRGHDPHVDAQRLRATHPLELLLFERPEDLRLERKRKIANLVEEERAAMGELEPAWLALCGAGESPLLVAE